jgi:hypothetical protein
MLLSVLNDHGHYNEGAVLLTESFQSEADAPTHALPSYLSLRTEQYTTYGQTETLHSETANYS